MPKEKVRNDKQRSTKHTHKTKDRVTRIQLKTGVNSDACDHYCLDMIVWFVDSGDIVTITV
jgi:hypothetical protein